MRFAVLLSVLVLSVCVSSSLGQLFQPDSAVASSEFSSSYLIGNTIDGSGLPGVWSFNTPHATYVQNNHWTTQFGAVDPNATFFFDEPKTIRQFFLWNHRSNGVAADPNYAVKRFTLTFFDGDGEVLATVEDLPAEQNVARAQLYAFEVVEGVRSVRVDILENYGSPYKGFAEVAFSPTVLACNGADLAPPVGILNFFDLATFLDLFNNQDPLADLAEPVGVFNFFDVSAYIDLYNAGCL
ncbi:MAG: hypothetical protein LAT64_14550 [Phycisphaerales bacterium]|nr:hypothetical protein [Planctomycetota bacterium]MCH8509968.1 hypothetical protein [Phycisphaerales bacterium]